MPALYELNGREIIRVHELPIGPSSLGRDLANQIVLQELSVSRFHCRIVADRSEVWIEDCLSRNGTYVGGRRIDSVTRLLTGTRLQLGQVAFVFWNDVATDPTINIGDDLGNHPKKSSDETCQVRVWWRFDWNCITWGWRIRRR